MRDLRDLAGLLLGLHALAALPLSVGTYAGEPTLIFFSAAFLLVNIMESVWVAENMGILTNSFLAGLMWFTLIIGRPFALQYARAALPKEQWHNRGLIRSGRFITIVWAMLMTISAAVSVFRKADLVSLPVWVYFDISLLIIIFGLAYTTFYRRKKRMQRERVQSPNN